MIQFLAPEWFFLIPLLMLAGWKFKPLRLFSPLRLMIQAVLVLALVQPVIDQGGNGMDLWVMIDRSDSTDGRPAAAATEIQAILEQRKHPEDTVRLVDFAQEAVLRDRGNSIYSGSTAGSRMEEALAYTLAQMNPSRYNRILMVTDGWPTSPLHNAPEQLIRTGVALDYRIEAPGHDTDIRIDRIHTPSRIRPGEAFVMEVALTGPPGARTAVPWQISREGAPPLTGQAQLVNGKAFIRLTDRLTTSGCAAYDILITPSGDPVTGNNRAQSLVEVTGGNSILLLSGYDRDPLEPFLTAQGFLVQRPKEPGDLNARLLTGTGLVIINNLKAADLPLPFLRALDYYVREQGGGLLMAGGRQSFGSGGYFRSPVDELLPVSMELKKDRSHLLTAMSIVMDRSGSMAASVSGGKTKMDLANSGACQTLSLLSDEDFISVHAVDSEPHEIVGMGRIGANRQDMIRAVSRIESMGGGIYVGAGLKAGWEQLQKTAAGTRHLILFSDADDSEEPEDYKTTLSQMTAAGATVSVIALGTKTSSDARLLEEIASLGKGRIFFCDRPGDIPGIFAQETVSVARATFIKDPTPVHGTPGWLQIAASSPVWPRVIDGYNLCYLRDGATAACLTADSYQAPLVAFWSRGAGRVAAVTFPMGGEYGKSIQLWPGYGDFTQTLARWLNRQDTPPGYSLRTDITGDRLTVSLYYSDEHIAQLARHMPGISLELTGETETRTISGIWERMQPGAFQCSFPLPPGTTARGSIRIGDKTLPFGPVMQHMNPEWVMSKDARQAFLDMSARSGGRERLDLAAIMQEPRPTSRLALRPWLLWLLLALALTDALLTKTGLLPKETRHITHPAV